MISANFQQGMELVSCLRWTLTENYWLIYAAAIMWDIIFSHWVNLKLALRFHALLIKMILPL